MYFIKPIICDPLQAYYSSPALTLDAALKFSDAHIDLIQDATMYMFIEQAVRGGLSVASSHYAKANNPHVPDYNSEKPTSWIFYQVYKTSKRCKHFMIFKFRGGRPAGFTHGID